MSDGNDADLAAVARALLAANQQMVEANAHLAAALARLIPARPAAPPAFLPTSFQGEILAALKGKSLRTDALAAKLGCGKSRLFADPGGVPELIEHGLVGHHQRAGYYRVDAPPDWNQTETGTAT